MAPNPPDSDHLSRMFTSGYAATYSKREVIIRADDNPQGVYYLKSGYVKMNSVLFNGQEITLNIFKPGAMFPVMWAVGNLPNSYYFQTITKAEVSRIPQAEFVSLLKNNQEILFDLTNRILIGMNGLLFNINHILSGNSYQRVIAALLMLCRRFGEDQGNGRVSVNLPLTHQDIADIAAITRETASINIKKLENLGLVSQQNHLFIISDMDKLEKESDLTIHELDRDLII